MKRHVPGDRNGRRTEVEYIYFIYLYYRRNNTALKEGVLTKQQDASTVCSSKVLPIMQNVSSFHE